MRTFTKIQRYFTRKCMIDNRKDQLTIIRAFIDLNDNHITWMIFRYLSFNLYRPICFTIYKTQVCYFDSILHAILCIFNSSFYFFVFINDVKFIDIIIYIILYFIFLLSQFIHIIINNYLYMYIDIIITTLH